MGTGFDVTLPSRLGVKTTTVSCELEYLGIDSISLKMNNRKSKGKKRKLSDLEESSSEDSSEKGEDLDSDVEDKNSGDEDEEDSDSDASHSSTESQSSSGSSVRNVRKTKPSGPDALMSDSSESGDENCEKCAICLRSITSQEVGNPEVCDHIFCSVCIIEWSKNSNVCPLDRQQFSIVLVRENKHGKVAKKVPVEEPQAAGVENVEFEGLDDTVCEICGFGDREDILLLCDICDRGFHTVCLTPPLENIPDENEWFCPDCDLRAPNTAESLADFFDIPSTSRSLRPRIQLVRTRLLERIRVTVNRIVKNYVLQHPTELDSSDYESELESLAEEDFTSESELEMSDEDQPGTSEPSQSQTKKKKPPTRKRKRKTTRSRKRTGKTGKKTTTRKRKTTSTKRKSTAATGKRKTKKRKTRVRTVRTKRVKVENADGTITEKIVKTRTYKKRRKQKRKKYKVKSLGTGRRGLRVKSVTTPKTVKGRLAVTLGMVPPKKPGQLLPDVKIRPPNSHISAIDLNRARAGIPKLHIFAPRDELQYYSSESDREEFIGGGSGGVATVVPQRSNALRLRDRKKAALAFHSRPPTASKPKPVIEPPTSDCVDILGSILDSQAVWHSKNTNVKINEDGSIEVIKDRENNNVPATGTESKPEDNKTLDVREGKPEGLTTQAPMQPGAGSRPGGFRPRSSYGEARSGGQDNAFSPRGGQSSTGVNFNRFGAPARNDREGYTNYLNNIPQGPTPFCRGGPPLRFRMPPRQQLRRITIPVRNRPGWQREEEEDEENDKDKEQEDKEKKEGEEESNEEVQPKKQDEEDDIDLYSDIEANAEKGDNSGTEEEPASFPALGPPPEPPAFLLGLEENGEFSISENKDKSEVYDPAEPCDSEDEMVIDENKEQSPTPEKNEPEQKSEAPQTSPKTEADNPSVRKATSEEDDDDEDDCPIFSIYSSATREFSQKEEEERQREIQEERRKIEELKLQENKSSPALENDAPEAENPENVEQSEETIDELAESNQEDKEKENVEDPVSVDAEPKVEDKDTQGGSSPSPKSGREDSQSPSKSIVDDKVTQREGSPSSESDKDKKSKSPASGREKSTSPDRKYKRSKRKSKNYDSDSDEEAAKLGQRSDDDKENEEARVQIGKKEDEEKSEKGEDESESEAASQRVATGLEGLEVEEVSSDNGDGAEFGDKRSLSSLSLSELSNRSKRSRSPVQMKKKNKRKKKKTGKATKPGKNYEEGEIDDSEKDNRVEDTFEGAKNASEQVGNENATKTGENKKRRRSASTGSERQILASKENKKVSKDKDSKEKDLSWKKPSKKEKNYREGKKRSKERGRSRSGDRRKSKSPSPRKDKKKNKDRKKKSEKKKEIERYDVRKIVKNKEIRKTDAFGRDIVSKSRSFSRSRSRSPIRDRSRNMLRRDSRSFSRSRSRSFRRGRSPVRRRYLRSRTRSRSKSIRSVRRSYSRSRSRSRSRKTKKKPKSKDRLKLRSRSRGRKSRSLSRGRRRSLTRSRSRSPIAKIRSKKTGRSRRSWSHHLSRSPSFSSRRSRSMTRSPIRVRRSYTRSVSSRSWSRGGSPLPRTSSLEKLTVVLTTKDKKKKRREGRKSRKEEKKRKKTGNSKEVFASGDNVLVSVNFRNNSSVGNNVISSDARNTRLNSVSPIPETEISRKKKKGSDYESEKVTKKSKKSNPISKKVVDVALSSSCKRVKKLTRLSEKDAEVILNRKPVAVIDLDMSPYREQTPSPVNVVVVSDSGSGDEGKEHTPQRPAVRATPGIEVEVIQENVVSQSVNVSAPSSPVENDYVPTSGPKTPPEPQIKFSINKPQQLRQIANPLGDDDDDDEVEEEEGEQRVESLDRRIEKELNPKNEAPHKGPNTPPAPRGPSTPKTPPSPQTSPDAYDPFEPTKSRSPSPSQADKENRPSPKADGKDDQASGGVQGDGLNAVVSNSSEIAEKNDVILENHDDKAETLEKGEAIAQADCSSNVIANQAAAAPVSDIAVNESPERKTGPVVSTAQSKTQPQAIQKPYVPVLKQIPIVSTASAAPPTSANLTASSDMFSMPSPTKTSRSGATNTTQSLQMTGIQRLQHRLGSPVNRTPNSVKSTPEKRATPRTETNEIMSSGNYMIRNASKRNGEQTKQPRPLQDATNETIDMTMDLDDSPYSPASSEGDDLFDPPVEPPKPSNPKPTPYKVVSKPTHKSPVKQLSKFDLLFGPCGPTLSPAKAGNKKANAKVPPKAAVVPKVLPQKQQKKPAPANKKNVMHKMDEDQLRILDELPSSAVELQVKDKFLKKLNRQERVVDEVKTVLKPHYARKHITKEEYKDILRRSVPKICHSRSGEINPSKIQSLIEAYVRKFRHAKKKGINAVSKPKSKKTMFS